MNNQIYTYGNSNPVANATNVLNGKKLAACGDSITEGTSSHEQDKKGYYKNYAWFVAQRNNMTLYNDGISGTTMINNGNPNCFSVNRYKQIPLDSDYITIWFGINDSVNEQNIGDIDSTDNTTFYGAWNVVVSYLIEHMPATTKIGLVASHSMSKQKREVVLAIAKKYGLKVFDIYGDPNIPFWFNKPTAEAPDEAVRTFRLEQWFVDGQHPSKAGYEVISTAYENWLRTL